jgi:hypothetical protein
MARSGLCTRCTLRDGLTALLLPRAAPPSEGAHRYGNWGGGDRRALLARFPDTALAVPPQDLRWRAVSFMNGLDSLPIRIT